MTQCITSCMTQNMAAIFFAKSAKIGCMTQKCMTQKYRPLFKALHSTGGLCAIISERRQRKYFKLSFSFTSTHGIFVCECVICA